MGLVSPLRLLHLLQCRNPRRRQRLPNSSLESKANFESRQGHQEAHRKLIGRTALQIRLEGTALTVILKLTGITIVR